MQGDSSSYMSYCSRIQFIMQLPRNGHSLSRLVSHDFLPSITGQSLSFCMQDDAITRQYAISGRSNMINLVKATLANTRLRLSKLLVPISQLPSSRPGSPPHFTEEPNYYTRGGFHPISLGDTFNSERYTILRKLGYGQYSTVWLARDSKYVVCCPNSPGC